MKTTEGLTLFVKGQDATNDVSSERLHISSAKSTASFRAHLEAQHGHSAEHEPREGLAKATIQRISPMTWSSRFGVLPSALSNEPSRAPRCRCWGLPRLPSRFLSADRCPGEVRHSQQPSCPLPWSRAPPDRDASLPQSDDDEWHSIRLGLKVGTLTKASLCLHLHHNVCRLLAETEQLAKWSGS